MSEKACYNLEIRRLWPPDMEAYRDHLLRLDPRSRHERFGGGMSDDFVVHYAERSFRRGVLLYGAFVDGHLRGVAELRSIEATGSEDAPFGRDAKAEAAFSVEAECQRRGIGEKLFRRIQRAATNHAVETIEIICLPENTGMRKLAQKFKTQFTFEDEILAGRLRARRPTSVSLIREASGDMLDYGQALFDARWRAFRDAARAPETPPETSAGAEPGPGVAPGSPGSRPLARPAAAR